jgi:single-strand DNA-binding protein
VEDTVNGPQITVVGNVGADPRLRNLADGTFVADFRVAMTPSRYDKAREAWVDQETSWFKVTCWRTLAEHTHMSVHKGDKVIVTGTFSARPWTDKDGIVRVSNEIDASSVGVDLTRGPVLQKRFERSATAETGERTDTSTDEGITVDRFTGEILADEVLADGVLADEAEPDQVAA